MTDLVNNTLYHYSTFIALYGKYNKAFFFSEPEVEAAATAAPVEAEAPAQVSDFFIEL